MDNIKIVSLEVGSLPKIKEVPNTLDAVQELVGGYLEAVYLPYGIILMANEEGMLMDLPVNFYTVVLNMEGKMKPTATIHGNVFFTSSDTSGEFISLTEEQIDYIISTFAVNRMTYLLMNN